MVCPTAAFSPSRIQSQCRAWKRNGKIIVAGGGKAALRRFEENVEALQGGGKKNGRRRSRHQSRVAPVALLLSSPSQTLRLTPLTSALRAARAHDAVLRMYPDLPLRFIKIHGDILVSYAYDEDFELRNEVTVTFPIEGIFQKSFYF